MAQAGRPPSRPGSGPGRGSRRRRPPAAAPVQPQSKLHQPDQSPDDLEEVDVDDERTRELVVQRRRSGVTTRAIALSVVLLLLTISYSSSLRVYFEQRQEIAAAEAEIAERERNIDSLEEELARWDDPEYVKAQARDRLGWVVPGERGYRVVGPDGEPIVPGAEIESEDGEDEPLTWWEKLNGSFRSADEPRRKVPVPSTEPTAPPKTIGPNESEPSDDPSDKEPR